ncbi:MAG: cytochrome c [Verrucomicrobiota bacterium]
MKHWLLLGVLISAGCVVEEPIPPAPTAEMAAASGVSGETLQRGRAVYMSDCTRCHEAKMPGDVSSKDWHVVLPGMAWNAGISEADEEAVEAYIKAVKGSS